MPKYCVCTVLQVATEHAILAQLAEQELSFQVPTVLPALNTGAPYVVLSNGAAACIFEVIPGEPAWQAPVAAVPCCKHTPVGCCIPRYEQWFVLSVCANSDMGYRRRYPLANSNRYTYAYE